METQSWDDSFNTYAFSKRACEIMKYFNVKYECLNACNDYSKQQDDKNGRPVFWWRPDAEEYDLGEIDMGENQAMQGADFCVDEDKSPEALK